MNVKLGIPRADCPMQFYMRLEYLHILVSTGVMEPIARVPRYQGMTVHYFHMICARLAICVHLYGSTEEGHLNESGGSHRCLSVIPTETIQ